MILSRQTVKDHLQEARDVGSQYLLHDMHVHAFELCLKPINYTEDPEIPGVFAVRNSNYSKPSAHDIDLQQAEALSDQDAHNCGVLSLQALMAYRYAGPQVLADRMAFSGISRCLLLPVPMSPESVEPDHKRLDQMQVADPSRFIYAAGVPADASDAPFLLHSICDHFSPRALKIHPNFSGIDLGSSAGRGWLESMLAAATAHGLPSIVHGGRSILLPTGEMSSYACIENLLTVDWSASDKPTVISHAGAFGCSLEEVKNEVLPGMQKLFAKHSHLYADTAGLSYEVTLEVLKELGPDRLLFGSDEMYFPQWQAMAILVHACKSLWNALGEEFISIAHGNSSHVLQGTEVTT